MENPAREYDYPLRPILNTNREVRKARKARTVGPEHFGPRFLFQRCLTQIRDNANYGDPRGAGQVADPRPNFSAQRVTRSPKCLCKALIHNCNRVILQIAIIEIPAW